MYHTETAHGTFTAQGNKYLTTPQMIQTYGGNVPANLYQAADLWLKAPVNLSIFILPIALHLIPIPFLALLSVLLFWMWAEVSLAPKANWHKHRWMTFLSNPFFQIGWYVSSMGLLIYLCLNVYIKTNPKVTFPYEALGIAVLMFALWKSGLLSRIFKGAFDKSREKRFPYSAEDLALHGLLSNQTSMDLPQLRQVVAQLVEDAERL